MKRDLGRRFAITILTALGMEVIVFAQSKLSLPDNASIEGSVLDDSGTPVQARVILSRYGFQLETSTASAGKFKFTGLKAGKYLLCAEPRQAIRPNEDLRLCPEPIVRSSCPAPGHPGDIRRRIQRRRKYNPPHVRGG